MYPEREKSQKLQKCAFRSLCLEHCISKLQQLFFHKSPSFLCLFPTDLLYHFDLTLWKLKSSSAVYTKVDAIYDISPPDTVRDVSNLHVGNNNSPHFHFIYVHVGQYRDSSSCIRESVDSLCRDGANTSIVHIHQKAF